MYIEEAKNWSELRQNFRWQIPTNYNLAFECCDKWAQTNPERTALLDWQDSDLTPHTYGWLFDQSCRLANSLKQRGIKPGDRVAILLPQCPQVAAIHMAIYKMGAIAVPLALLFGPDALDYRLKTSGARALFTNAVGLEKVAPLQANLPDLAALYCIEGSLGNTLDYNREITSSSQEFAPIPSSPDTPALMIFTSGTTGPPKGALHAHRVLAGHMPGMGVLHEFTPKGDDRFWTPADWAWAGGLLNILLPGLALGAPVVCGGPQKFNPEMAFELITRAKIRNTFIPPTALKIMRSVENPAKRFGYTLRSMFSGGEALGKETFEWGHEALGITINEGYGQTEANLVLTSCGALGVSKAGSMGKPTPGYEVAIIREDGSVCDVGETGQIAVKRPAPVMFLEYWQRPDATADKFVGDWMKTGDQGTMDEEGYFHFFGRDDDVITSAGFRIGPGEIEDCLIGHPAIKLAAAVGKPDPIRTEIVKCFLVLEDSISPSEFLKTEISDYVRSKLSAHEYPREIEFVDEMPLTTSGKVIRREFRERVIAEAQET